ncbi:hypothetical protein AAVH_22020 [Aphelenchoides avenae]|nr:hypothetical protein AAVH_22020 [Aphelenchus avenae]
MRAFFCRFLLSYIDACVCFDAALKLMFPEGLLLSSAYKSAALDALGFFQRAKKALEPALRLGPQMPQVQICRQALAVKKKDDPKIDPALLDNYDPLAGEGFAYDVRRRVYTGLLKAMEKIYDDEPGPLWPNTSIRELEWHIINEGLRAMRSETFVYAAILLSVVISVSDRTDYALLANRAQAWLHGPLVQNCFCYLLDNYDPLAGEGFAYDVRRRVYTGLLKAMGDAYSAYIDASKALKLRPNFGPAIYFKSVALYRLGFYERMRHCARLLHQKNPGFDAEPLNDVLATVAGLDAHDACDILAVLNEVKGAKCLKEGDVEKALEHLNQALCCGKPPGVLSLRAKALLKSKRYLDAYADAIRAAKYDPTFLEAVELKGQSLAAMGYFTKAHACFREVIKFDPKNDDVRQRMGSIKNKLDRFMEGPFARPGGRGKHRPYLHMRMPLKLLTHCCPV